MQVKPAPKREGYLCVGVIIGAHGILGATKVKPFLGDFDFLANTRTILAENDTEYTLKSIKTVGQNKYAFNFKEINTCNAAEALKGTHVYVQVDDIAADNQPPEVVVDLAVFNHVGKKIGHVLNIFYNGAHEVLEIQLNEGKEVLIPHTEDYVEQQDDSIKLTSDATAFLTL